MHEVNCDFSLSDKEPTSTYCYCSCEGIPYLQILTYSWLFSRQIFNYAFLNPNRRCSAVRKARRAWRSERFVWGLGRTLSDSLSSSETSWSHAKHM